MSPAGQVFLSIIQSAIVLQLILGLASMCTWFERKLSALMQNRIGANRAGAKIDFTVKSINTWPFLFRPLGARITYIVFFIPIKILQFLGVLGLVNTLINDSFKAILKEDFVPNGTSYFLHAFAPFLATLPVFLAFAVFPLSPSFILFGTEIRLQVAALPTGILFVLAMGAIAVYGVAIAGWAGQNKFSLLGGLRAVAQMISYELSMGLAFVSAVVWYGTVDITAMIESQRECWGMVKMPLTFIILLIVGMAETKRGPFDMPESESELVAGYFTEYSGMKFLLFWLAEFAEIALFSLVLSSLFLGGWYLPFVHLPFEGTFIGAFLGHLILVSKVIVLCGFQIIVRWTLPRFRYDQLLSLGWKGLLPISMCNLVLVTLFKLYF